MKCKCGCGKNTKGGDYCIGHHPNSGFKVGHPLYLKPGTRKKLQIKSKENWTDEKIRQKRIKGLKKSYTIERKEKARINKLKWWENNKNKSRVIKMLINLGKIKKGKTYEEFYGGSKGNNIKRKISKACTNRKFSDGTRKLLRERAIKRIEKQKFYDYPLIPCMGKNEKQIIDNFEKEIGYKILRQYQIEGYFIDGYCKELNLAIEVDEDYHKKQKEKDAKRENIIKKVLNCEFVRI